jgi:hypothetical protein
MQASTGGTLTIAMQAILGWEDNSRALAASSRCCSDAPFAADAVVDTSEYGLKYHIPQGSFGSVNPRVEHWET